MRQTNETDARLSGNGIREDAAAFEDIFFPSDIQRLQDAFAEAAGVPSRITDPLGHPLTRPSNTAAGVPDILLSTGLGPHSRPRTAIRPDPATERGPDDPALGIILEAGAGIFCRGRRIAEWRIGPVLDASVDTETVIARCQSAGDDAKAFREALQRAPRVSRTRFNAILRGLRGLARHLSSLADIHFERSLPATGKRPPQSAPQLSAIYDLAAIIDFLPDPTLVVDQNGVVIFWNRELEKLTGVSASDMLGKSGFEYGTPFYGTPTPILADYVRGAVPCPDNRYAVAAAGPGEIIAEVSLSTLPDGPRRIWAKAVALRDSRGGIIGAIEAIRDITDRHRAETALRESEEKYRRMVETAHEGVWVVDADDRTTFVNRRMGRMLGYAPEEMLGKSLIEFLPAEHSGAVMRQIARRKLGHSDIFEQNLLRKDGSGLWCLVSASPLYDAPGRYAGSLGMFTDITARKAAEEALALQRQHLEATVEERTRDIQSQALELAEANIRLSELDRMKSAFLSTVSHELRTPLTAILGFAKLIGREFTEQFLPLAGDNAALTGKGRRIAENLNVILNEAERLTRLINDVLDLTRIESGNMVWRDCRFDPLDIARKAARSIAGLLEQRPGVVFDLDIPETFPDLCMDPDQLAQVVSNLLQNAAKFTKAGSIRLEIRRDGDDMLLSVRDTGIGIPANQLECIFDKFHQVGHGDTVSDTTKGTGLGLSICRQIVQHYGGKIWARSEPGRGSTFFVRLPLAGDASEDGDAVATSLGGGT